jgi:hypothetical protein
VMTARIPFCHKVTVVFVYYRVCSRIFVEEMIFHGNIVTSFIGSS